ncbi:hypothetical protein [Hahella chejuensis]|nr:hypothetical protein [Hahella chejuensis]
MAELNVLKQEDIDDLVRQYEGRSIPRFVASATLASELKSTIHYAKLIAISSKNAQAITARAGEWGQGFSGITQFIEEIASRSMVCAADIGAASRELSRSAVKLMNQQKFASALNRSMRANQAKSEELREILQRNLKDQAQLEEQTNGYYRSVRKLLTEIRDCTRALKSIVANCRIEASRAGPFQESLFTIAENIENAAERISERIAIGLRLMGLLT